MNPALWAGVLVFGGLGSVARFVIDRAVGARMAGAFPLGTLTVNLSGALALGLLTGLALGNEVMLLGGTALLGGYTTFSTWMLETQRLTEERQVRTAVANVALSVLLGVAGAAAGAWIGGRL